MTVSDGTILDKIVVESLSEDPVPEGANHLKSRGRTFQVEDRAKALMGTGLESSKRRKKNSTAEV